jgi:uncharacterized protein YkwD
MTDLRPRCHRLAPLLALLAAAQVRAAVIDSVNSVRAQGCPGGRSAVAVLRPQARLDALARQLAQGTAQAVAAERAGYRAQRLLALTIAPVEESGEVAQTLREQFCRAVTDPQLTELGSYRAGSTLWLVLAMPFEAPAAQQLPRLAARVLELTNTARVLELTNTARASARHCGGEAFAAAPPLALNGTLASVALAYARELAAFGYLDHTGRDGSSPAERITRGGYRWREAGENLASGMTTPEQLVAGWLQSPPHCANLMSPAYREAGVAFADNPHSPAGIYWAMEFGTPP